MATTSGPYGGKRDLLGKQTKFEATNFVEDYTFDCNSATEVGDALATLIRDLAQLGIINATVTTA